MIRRRDGWAEMTVGVAALIALWRCLLCLHSRKYVAFSPSRDYDELCAAL
jgi:hypothetical protein